MSSVNKFSVGTGERMVTRILAMRQDVTFPTDRIPSSRATDVVDKKESKGTYIMKISCRIVNPIIRSACDIANPE